MEEGTNWFVVTGFQFHVTPIMKLINICSSPKNPVTPSWNPTFPTTNKEGNYKQNIPHKNVIPTTQVETCIRLLLYASPSLAIQVLSSLLYCKLCGGLCLLVCH